MALIMLRNERSVLAAAEQAVLARDAATALALRSRNTPNPQAVLQEVRQARGNGRDRIDENAERILEALEARLAQRVLIALLKEVAGLAAKERWAEIAQKAQQHIQQQRPAPEARKVMEELVRVGNQLGALATLQTALDSAAAGRRAEAASLLRAIPVKHLRVDVRSLNTLREGSKLLSLTDQPWKQAPNVADLKLTVANLDQALGEKALGGLILQDLAMKAFLEGFSSEAVSLLPDNSSAKHAAELLRDMNTLVQGEGTVSTWPAKQALARADRPGPPPGLEQLIPEKAQEWRKGIRQASPGAPCPLDKVVAADKAMREKVAASAGQQRQQMSVPAAKAVQSAGLLRQKLVQQDKDDEQLIADFEKPLQRKLGAAERLIVRQMRRQGKKADDIRASLAAMKLAAK
jgi:hypothetical protein